MEQKRIKVDFSEFVEAAFKQTVDVIETKYGTDKRKHPVGLFESLYVQCLIRCFGSGDEYNKLYNYLFEDYYND